MLKKYSLSDAKTEKEEKSEEGLEETIPRTTASSHKGLFKRSLFAHKHSHLITNFIRNRIFCNLIDQ